MQLKRSARACLLVLGLAGCGGQSDAVPRQAVSGTVTFGGQPLTQGTIQFLPASTEQSTAALVPVTRGPDL